jgi:hypothetical protein
MTTTTDKSTALPARLPRPLHTRKSAWKLGWPTRPAHPRGDQRPAATAI